MGVFKEYVGNCALNGKFVVSYYERNGDITVRAETASGKSVPYSYADDEGNERYRTVSPRTMTAEQYESFKDSAMAGLSGDRDAVAVQRALGFLGYPDLE